MIAAQPYCMICKATDNLKVDHCHKTRRLRCVLCNSCNRGLGFFKDDATLLKRAALYLEITAEVPR
jgi:hypothetical protein